MDDRKKSRSAATLRFLFRDHSRLRTEAVVLVLFSLGDLLMTYLLLWQGGNFYEANPVADFFYSRWNIAGMTMFKFGLVGFILVLSEVIERHRPGLGRAIMILGCVTALAVTVHGLRLLMAHVGWEPPLG